MSLQRDYFAIILVLNLFISKCTLGARPDILHPRKAHKLLPIRVRSSEDPDAVFRHDDATMPFSTKLGHRKFDRKLLASKIQNRTATGRVAWGQKAAPGQFPWVAYFDPEGVCTASLITPRAMLSAAHCVFEDDVWTNWKKAAIYIGSNYWYDDNMLEYGVKAAWIPEVYRKGTGYGLYGDISVVGLTSAVPSSIQPVTMASSATSLAGVNSLTIIGWGQLQNGKMPDYLYYATLKYNQAQCMARYNELFEGEPIEKDHICTGAGSNPATQSCGGDSGGPTVLMRAGKPPVQIAVTSYGYGGDDNCGIPEENINADTSVAYWRTWIEDILSYQNLRGAAPPARLNTVVYDTCYSGATTLKTFKASAGYKCCDACRALILCKAWTHVSSTSTCTLMNSKGNSVKDKACTSGWYK